MTASYKSLIGKTKQQVHDAQQVLVNLAIREALNLMYAKAEKGRLPLATHAEYVTTTDQGIIKKSVHLQKERRGHWVDCGNAEEAMDVLAQIPNQYERVRAYNQLAKANKFDLSLKSSGAKSPDSIVEKMRKRHWTANRVGDIVRLTAVSNDLPFLHDYLTCLGKETEKFARFSAQTTPKVEFKEMMTATGVYKETMNSSVNGINAEVLGIPRQLARVAMRASHTYYEVSRKWETYEEQRDIATGTSRNAQGSEHIMEVMERRELRRSVIDAYTSIAHVIHDLYDGKAVTPDYLLEVNNLFKNDDMSPITYDEISEGGAPEPSRHIAGWRAAKSHNEGHPPYSPVFKTVDDLIDYKEYFQSVGSKMTVQHQGIRAPLFLLPTIDDATPDAEIAMAIGQLKDVTCLTHACYMSRADVEAREIYVNKAIELNAKPKRPNDRIPDSLIDSVNQGRGERAGIAVSDITMAGMNHAR